MWSSGTSPGFLVLHNFLQFRVVLQSSLKARGMLKVPAQGVSRVLCCGYKITASWLDPRNPPKGAAERKKRCSFKMPHLPGTHHHLWVTDMVITAYQVSACLRKALSHTSTHEWSLQTKTILMWLRLKSSDRLQPDSPFFLKFSNHTQYFQRGFIKRRDWCLLKTYCGDIRKYLSLLRESYIGKECAWFILEITHD